MNTDVKDYIKNTVNKKSTFNFSDTEAEGYQMSLDEIDLTDSVRLKIEAIKKQNDSSKPMLNDNWVYVGTFEDPERDDVLLFVLSDLDTREIYGSLVMYTDSGVFVESFI